MATRISKRAGRTSQSGSPRLLSHRGRGQPTNTTLHMRRWCPELNRQIKYHAAYVISPHYLLVQFGCVNSFLIFFRAFKVSFRYVYVDRNTGVDPTAADAQSEFNNKKAELQPDVDKAKSSAGQIDWVQFKSESGLEIKDNDPSNFKVDDVEAYCSDDGAVVTKCDAADLNCFRTNPSNTSCKCNKDKGSITKCSECLFLPNNPF